MHEVKPRVKLIDSVMSADGSFLLAVSPFESFSASSALWLNIYRAAICAKTLLHLSPHQKQIAASGAFPPIKLNLISYHGKKEENFLNKRN